MTSIYPQRGPRLRSRSVDVSSGAYWTTMSDERTSSRQSQQACRVEPFDVITALQQDSERYCRVSVQGGGLALKEEKGLNEYYSTERRGSGMLLQCYLHNLLSELIIATSSAIVLP